MLLTSIFLCMERVLYHVSRGEIALQNMHDGLDILTDRYPTDNTIFLKTFAIFRQLQC